MSSQMSPQVLALLLISKIEYSCYKETKSAYSYIECIANHLPEKLEDFAVKYAINGKNFLEILKNTDVKFKEEFKKEYENLWKEYLATTIVERLIDLLEAGQIHVAENGNLTDDEKKQLLEKYKVGLEELANEIEKTVNKQEPMSDDKLKEYLLKLYKIVGFRYNYPNDPIDHYVNYYDFLDKAGKLRLLELFLDGINNKLLYEIEIA